MIAVSATVIGLYTALGLIKLRIQPYQAPRARERDIALRRVSLDLYEVSQFG